jgi:hypothetical protein
MLPENLLGTPAVLVDREVVLLVQPLMRLVELMQLRDGLVTVVRNGIRSMAACPFELSDKRAELVVRPAGDPRRVHGRDLGGRPAHRAWTQADRSRPQAFRDAKVNRAARVPSCGFDLFSAEYRQ